MVYSFPPSNAVMTSLSPATIGEEDPAGAGTFHFTFLSGPNSTGGFWPSAAPDPPGPRNPGHASGLSPPVPTAANTPRATDAINSFMTLPSVVVDTGRRGEVGRAPGLANPLEPDLLKRASGG